MARYGEQGGDISESLARMKEVAAQQQEIDAKEKRYQETQERSGELARANARARRDVGRATTEVSDSFTSSQERLAADTEAWRANTIVLRENLGLREQIRQVGGTVALAPVSAPTAAPAPVAATRAPRLPAAPSVVATGDLESARAAERAALARVEQARVDVAEARRAKAPPEDIASLRQTGTLASAEARAARSNITALEREAAASEAAAVAAREKAVADERAAVASRLKAEADYRAAQATQHYAPSGVGGALPGGFGLGAVSTAEQERQAVARAVAEAQQQRLAREYEAAQAAKPYAPMGVGGVPPGGGPPPRPPAPPGGAGGGGGQDDYNRRLREQAASAGAASTSERALQRDIQASGAAYAASSNALSRHGALTTEFIQALARGDVTLREFGSQMVSTIGKFGGWLVAGAAIFGVIKLFEDLKDGATETQNAITTLGRFLPGLGGPAGGGNDQVHAAQDTLRGISTQFNVPISEVGDAMQLVARVFHNLADAGEATRAVLAASKLDQVPVAQASQYLLGISQSMGYTSAAPLTGIVNRLNALQSQIGARVSQTLPALARAAPAALAAGLGGDQGTRQLEGLAGLLVSAGIPGGQAGTVLLRSLTNFLPKPGSQLALTQLLGSAPTATQFGPQLVEIVGEVARRAQEGRPFAQTTLRQVAGAIGGPSLGARGVLPLLEAAQANPEKVGIAMTATRGYQEDLTQQLQRVDEQFRSIGIGLQNFGSQLASVGALTPVTDLLDLLRFLGNTVQTAITPVEKLARAFDGLSTPVEDVVAGFVALLVAQRLYARTFVGSAAQQFVGRLASSDEIRNTPRQVIRQRLADARNVLLPEEQAQAQSARREAFLAEERHANAQRALARYEAESAGVGREGVAVAPESTAGEDYEAGYQQYNKAASTAATKRLTAMEAATDAEEQVAKREADIALMKDRSLTWAEKVAVMDERGFVAAAATVTLREEQNAILAAQIAAVRGGGVVGGRPPIAGGAAGGPGGGGGVAEGTLAGVTAAGAATATTVAAAVDEIGKPSVMQRLRSSIATGGSPPAEPGLTELAQRTLAFAGVAAPPREPSALARRALQYTGAAVPPQEEQAAAEAQASALSQRLSGYGTRAGEFARAALPGAPFAGLLGAQLAGSAVGGGTGQDIQQIGGGLFTGLLMAQLLGARGGALGIGAGIGSLAAATSSGGVGRGAVSLGFGAAGAGLGAAAGLLTGGALSPLGAMIGFGVGTTVGSIFSSATGIGGGGEDSQQKTERAITKAQQQGRAWLVNFNKSASDIDKFGAQFSSDLAEGLGGASDKAQSAQARVTSELQGLAAQVQIYGAKSREGRVAAEEMGQVVSSATAQLRTNPALSAQLLGSAQQSMQQIAQHTTEQIKYAPTGQVSGIAAGGLAQIDALTAQNRQDLRAAEQQRSTVAGQIKQQEGLFANSPLLKPLGGPGSLLSSVQAPSGDAQVLAQLQAARQNLDQKIRDLKGIDDALDAVRKDVQDQLGAAALARTEQPSQTRTQLRQAATTDPLRQAQLQVAQDTGDLSRTQHEHIMTHQGHQQAVAQAQAKLNQDTLTYGQQEAAHMQALGAVAQSAIPSTDPVGQATAALNTQAQIYRYMAAHERQFTPDQIAQALANRNTAQQALASAANQQQTELISSQEQLAQAQAHGDPGLIAAAQQAQGVAMLGIARTQAQKNAAKAMIISAEDAGVDATRQWADAQTSLAEARAHGDAGLIAAAELAGGQRDLGLAKNKYDRAAALTRIANAQTAGNEAARAIADAQTQVAVAGDYGNTVAQANDAIAGANRQLATAQTGAERLAGQAALLNAVNQREQAIADRFTEFAALAASETLDPVQAAKDLADGAQKALEHTTGIDNINKARTNRNQLLQSYRSLKIDNRESEINFEFQMSEIATGQAVSMLQGLLNLQGLTKAKRQQLLEEIRRYQLGQESPIGAQGFDLAPGNVRLPTFYDVAHAVQGRRVASAINHNDSRRYNNTVTVYVNRAEDVGAVSDAIDRSLGSNVRQRIKMAGIR